MRLHSTNKRAKKAKRLKSNNTIWYMFGGLLTKSEYKPKRDETTLVYLGNLGLAPTPELGQFKHMTLFGDGMRPIEIDLTRQAELVDKDTNKYSIQFDGNGHMLYVSLDK